MSALEREHKFFLDHQDELLKRYKGRFLVIFGDEVVGDYESELEAIDAALLKYELGTFLIHQCLPGDSAYTLTYHSHVCIRAYC